MQWKFYSFEKERKCIYIGSFYFYIGILGTYLGQNFLVDSKIRHWIGDKVAMLYSTFWAASLIEIWPGKGSLTKLIKDVSQNFFIFEKDVNLKEQLSEVLLNNSNYQLIRWDVLDVEFSMYSFNPQTTLVVGNLPYYITSPILRKFFSPPSNFLGGIFMIQHEVWEKIRYDAKKKSYLYWLLSYWYQVDYLKTVPAKSFNPPPKVKSCMIGLTKKSCLPQITFEKLLLFLDAFAPYSRKTLGKISKLLEKRWKFFAIPAFYQSKRLEELSWQDLEIILW